MLNFKITGTDQGLLTIVKPLGKSLPVRVGEVVRAEIMEILPTGGVTVKIKGVTITARTEVPLNKDSVVYFKVLGAGQRGTELNLQLVESPETALKPIPDETFDPLRALIRDLSGAAAKGAHQAGKGIQDIETILKALPRDISVLPADIKADLQTLLHGRLRSTGQSIASRFEALAGDISRFLSESGSPAAGAAANPIDGEFMVSIEKLLASALRRSIHDSGIALEAKLKTLAADAARQSPSEALSRTSSDSAGREVGQDLKARLLQLRELLQNTGQTDTDVSAQARGHQERGEGIAAQVANRGQLLQQADGLLRDIETLQALSKATDSFFTFLPVRWKELKDGEISFRKTKGSEKETPFSCRINLDLEKFGKMSVTVLQHNREFFVSFRVENEGFRSHLSDHMEELRQSLAQKGMPLRALHVHAMDDESSDILEPESFERNISIRA